MHKLHIHTAVKNVSTNIDVNTQYKQSDEEGQFHSISQYNIANGIKEYGSQSRMLMFLGILIYVKIYVVWKNKLKTDHIDYPWKQRTLSFYFAYFCI